MNGINDKVKDFTLQLQCWSRKDKNIFFLISYLTLKITWTKPIHELKINFQLPFLQIKQLFTVNCY